VIPLRDNILGILIGGVSTLAILWGRWLYFRKRLAWEMKKGAN
jgi:hypothetical protein